MVEHGRQAAAPVEADRNSERVTVVFEFKKEFLYFY